MAGELNLTRTDQGLEVTLRDSGPGRFVVAMFLLVWLAIWAIGVFFTCWMLLQGGWAVLIGQPPDSTRGSMEPASALAAGFFMLVWLAVWIPGGLMGGRELLRVLVGHDRLIVRADAVVVQRHFGLFCTQEILPRGQILRFYRWPSKGVLMADLVAGSVEITRFGFNDELDELAAVLNRECGLVLDVARDGALPAGWFERQSSEREAILVAAPFRRRKHARRAWFVCAGLFLLAGLLVSASSARTSLWVPAALVMVVAAFVGWGAYRLSCCQDEWVFGAGYLRRQWRTGDRVQVRFEANALHAREETDSEGDRSYSLVATKPGGAEGLRPGQERQHECPLLTRAGDPAEVLNLGRWLARRCALPFHDETTTAQSEK